MLTVCFGPCKINESLYTELNGLVILLIRVCELYRPLRLLPQNEKKNM